jgi:HAD superfamily hydrolase (TIGR01509 family)
VTVPFRSEAVVFDCDGTLLETESRWTMAEESVCARWGVPFDWSLKERLLGTHIDRAGEILAEWVGEPAAQAPVLGRALLEAYRAAVETHGVTSMPGAATLVDALAGQIPLAVASNTQIDLTRLVLSCSDLPEVFGAIVCAGPELTPKPQPDLYRAACATLGARPARSVAIEDSPVGAAAAQAAGMYLIAVPSPGATIAADHVVVSLEELTLSQLLGPA